jgi:hypothetical protein
MDDGALRNVSTFLPDYSTRVPVHRNLHGTDFLLKYPNTITELTVFGCAGKVAVIVIQQFHFSLSLRIVCKFGIISSRTLRWKNTQDCLNTVSYMRGRWRCLVEEITSNAIPLLSSFEAWILFSVVLVSDLT